VPLPDGMVEIQRFPEHIITPTTKADEGHDEDISKEEAFFYDFTNEEIDNRDPSLEIGLIKIYEEEVPFEIRIHHENLEKEKSIFELLLCKIFVTQEVNKNKDFIIKFEIASDKDLFFYYSTEINRNSFEQIQRQQKLICNIVKFYDLLIKYLDLCIEQNQKFMAVFNIQQDKMGKLEIMENLEYKFAELINLDFSPVSKDFINKQIIYRYNSMRGLFDMTQNRIDIINGVLKGSDPSLISEIKKSVSKITFDTNLIFNSLIPNKSKKKVIKNKKMN
jgi:hypothetical protein